MYHEKHEQFTPIGRELFIACSLIQMIWRYLQRERTRTQSPSYIKKSVLEQKRLVLIMLCCCLVVFEKTIQRFATSVLSYTIGNHGFKGFNVKMSFAKVQRKTESAKLSVDNLL